MSDLICRKSMARCQTQGMCAPHGGCQPPETASAFRSLLAERNALAFLLKRFVDGEHDQDENQAERHIYHGEAEAFLAYLGGDVQGHTLIPDEILRTEQEKKKALTAENEKLFKLLERMVDQYVPFTELEGVPGWSRVVELVEVASKRDLLKGFAIELVNASFEGGSFEGGDIQDIAMKHSLLRIERREAECGEVCACREYGFPAECYRKTPILGGGTDEVATLFANKENVSRHEGGES
jgi:hypothetical protein